MVDQLGHHPSIFTWNAHVSPAPEVMVARAPNSRTMAGKVASHQLPTWSKSVLDRSIKRVFESQDGSATPPRSPGSSPICPASTRPPPTCGSAGAEAPSATSPTTQPGGRRRSIRRRVRRAVGTRPTPIHRRRAMARHRLVRARATSWLRQRSFGRYAPPHGHTSFESWREATQLYQAGLLRRQIETLRRLKYQPTGGFCVHHLVDSRQRSAPPSSTASGPKLAFQAVADACRPVIVVADRLPAKLTPAPRSRSTCMWSTTSTRPAGRHRRGRAPLARRQPHVALHR